MSEWNKDQVTSDVLEEEVEYTPEGAEPRINCWVDVECADEVINYMFFDGPYVRDHVFADCVEGGHFYRYGWIPENQIWIEDLMSIVDRLCTGVHETHERYRMKYLGWGYDRAHMSALKTERTLRRLLLEEGTAVPPIEGVMKILQAEGNGGDSVEIAKELFYDSKDRIEAASEQSNAAVGKKYE